MTAHTEACRMPPIATATRESPWAHCGACHRTFASLALFDAHRTGLKDQRHCRSAVAMGLVELNGVWRTPEGAAKAERVTANLAAWRASQS